MKDIFELYCSAFLLRFCLSPTESASKRKFKSIMVVPCYEGVVVIILCFFLLPFPPSNSLNKKCLKRGTFVREREKELGNLSNLPIVVNILLRKW